MVMVRESRYIKVGQIPNDTTDEGVGDHFGKYGKVLSVRLEQQPACLEAVVAFTDIKAASQAYSEDQLLNGAIPMSIAFCDATGATQSEPRCPSVATNKSAESCTPPTAEDAQSTLGDKEG